MNVRYFEMDNGDWWFGGGIDLTPHYVNEEDAVFFHSALKTACDKHNPNYYPDFKKCADDYFFITHRKETRGIGGIFFDHLKSSDNIGERHGDGRNEVFEFVKTVGKSFIPIYSQLIEKNKNFSYGEKEKQWQLLRRGRYVEFNLIYDKGTRFGLETGGRVESILMSLPQTAGWLYNYVPPPNSSEAKTVAVLKKDTNWINANQI
jgi:coproporphyrinogen III oxidase